ncbi:hypothetical protein V8C44DRAFT_352623 [Trichoderma aethiopicum]
MEPKLYEIAPKGDTLLNLYNANAPFAVPAPSSTGSPRELQTSGSVAGGKPEVQLRLSSRHLTLASGYFEKLMASDWKEATPGGEYSYVINAEDWDEKALCFLMKIIHGRTAQLPREMELESLAKMTILADYYQCQEMVDFFMRTWLQPIDQSAISGRDRLLRLAISYVFPDHDVFRKLTEALITEEPMYVEFSGLPVPQTVIDAVNAEREKHLLAIVSGLKRLVKDEQSDKGLRCSFACSSMFIGALSKNMHSQRLSDRYLVPPYHGHSLVTLKDRIFEFREPSWNKICNAVRFDGSGHRCSLLKRTKPIVESQMAQVVGLELEHFIKTS